MSAFGKLLPDGEIASQVQLGAQKQGNGNIVSSGVGGRVLEPGRSESGGVIREVQMG